MKAERQPVIYGLTDYGEESGFHFTRDGKAQGCFEQQSNDLSNDLL